MPTYEITSPEGKKYRVTAPAGTSKDDILERVRQNAASKQEVQEPSAVGDFLKSIPTGAVGSIYQMGKGLAESDAPFSPNPPIELPSDQQMTKGLGLHEPAGTAGKLGAAVGGTLADPMTWMGPGGLGWKAGTGIAGGLGSELAGEATEGTAVELPARLLGGAAGSMAPRGAARALSPMPISSERAQSVGTLRQAGVNPTAGDVTGNRAMRYGENIFGDAPLAGGQYTKAKERIGREYTAAAARTGIGEDVNLLRPEVFRRVEDRLGNTFERVARQLPINHDQMLGDDLVQIRRQMLLDGMPYENVVQRVNAMIDNIQDGFVTQNNGRAVMSGETYQTLTRKNTNLARAIDDNDPNISYYAMLIRTALDNAMERSATGRGTRPGVGRRQALEDLREARRQWYNMIVLKNSVVGPGEQAAEGIVSPQKLRQSLTSSQDKKLQYAAGRGGGLQELARAGNEIMTPLPNSGTAQRGMGYGTAAAGALAAEHALSGNWPLAAKEATLAAAPGVTGRALMSRPVQGYLGNQRYVDVVRRLPPKTQDALRSFVNSLMIAPWDTDPMKDIGNYGGK